MTAHPARAALASRDVLPGRFCAMANASPRPRTICIAAPPAIARATIKDMPVVTAPHANRAPASKVV